MPHTLRIEAFLDNDSETFSYVVADTQSNMAVVIDPVLDFDYKSGRTATHGADEMLAFIRANELDVAWILETHAHADHLSAALYLREELGARIGIGRQITKVQAIFQTVFNLEKSFLPNGSQFDRLFDDGDSFQVGQMNIRVLHTPGHTPADLTYVINEQAAFVGDTLFMPDVGTARCDFPGGDATTLYRSIQKILALADDTEIYVCHDYPSNGRSHRYQTTVAQQRANNIHVGDDTSEQDFVQQRQLRDATLAMPRLILPSIQVNIRAGQLPPAEQNGVRYLKIPINKL